MKSRILSISIALVLFSCATKTPSVPATTTENATAAKTVELTPELVVGQNLYDNNCAKCHKLYEPKKFSQEQWKPILVRMQKKAHLDDTQMASISNYITSQL
ncbi:cytochrome c [Flavobacterium sp. Fl-77]|uniref:Cytochrome c n=1 Tax=Flavobacterium flavipigmentatum TaxID=2893884 RepID=A0AAJ2SBB1_9FLAO|nr:MULTISPECIES: cytochrome c [unclassified Flavobacterium]MDX6181953.1 cytochrome c [Flavobacterium sp. Fl-33]MDX6186992.1 cytochrome c [Flavobacterium sp. Fl-77]UFH37127.1 cytochrome c [Flavobacterium sp. F-70]